MKLQLKVGLVVLLVLVFSVGTSWARTGIKIGHVNGALQVDASGYYTQGFTLTSETPIPYLRTEITYCGANFKDTSGISRTLDYSEINLLLNWPFPLGAIGSVYVGAGLVYSSLPGHTGTLANLADFNFQGILGIESVGGYGFVQLRGFSSPTQSIKDYIGTSSIDIGIRI